LIARKKKADEEAKNLADKPDKPAASGSGSTTGNVAVVERDDSEAEFSWVVDRDSRD
jgi:hypothetical protein